MPPELAELNAQLDAAVAAAGSALAEVGEISRGVHPAILTSNGLRPAVRALARRSPVPVRLAGCTDRRLPEQVEVTAYYVIAESLTNAAKHARAAAVTVSAEVADDRLVVTIRDDGVGGADLARGTGLIGLRGPRRGAERRAAPREPAGSRDHAAGGAPAHGPTAGITTQSARS